MSERIKRVLLILGFIAVCVGMGFAIYWVFFRIHPGPSSLQKPGAANGRLPRAGALTAQPNDVPSSNEPSLPQNPSIPPPLALPEVQPTPSVSRTQIVSEAITRALSPAVTADASVRFYNPSDGLFYRITNDGLQIPLSDKPFLDVQDVSWGKASDKAVLTFPDGSHTSYDFTTNQQYTLPKYWEEFDFSPNDSQIVSKSVGNNEDNRFLVIANADGTGAKALEELGQNQDKVHVSWSPNNQTVAYAFTGEPLGFDRQAVVLVGQHHENFKNIITEGRGFIPNWSPSGQNILYSVYSGNDGFRPTLWVSGGSGDAINANRRNLGLQTWADKCAWHSEQLLYCAVPSDLGEGAGLQRDLFTNTKDLIYKIDLSSGALTNLGQPDGNPSVNQLTVSADGKAVFFNDRSSGKLVRFSVE